MTSPLWIFLAATFVIALAPGPNVMLVLGHAFKTGVRDSAGAILGLALAATTWMILAITGLGTVLHTWPQVLRALQLIGAGYLVSIGIRTLLSLKRLAAEDPLTKEPRATSPALQGFLTSLSNPKSLLYWSAFLPPFLDPARSLTMQLVTLGGLGILIEACVLFGYTFLAATTRRYVAAATRTRLLDAVAGLVFVGLGVYLVALSIIP